MNKQNPTVDIYFFEHQFELFRKYVLNKSGDGVESFSANSYIEGEEGYKYEVYSVARKVLNIGSWSENDIGKGKIIESVIKAIELKGNNLVKWQSMYGDKARPHHVLYVASKNVKKTVNIERALFDLYHSKDDNLAFNNLLEIFGRKYSIIAYLFFLKDRTRYMPIAPTYFDIAFKILGVDFITSHKCSWENYQAYNGILTELKLLITDKLQNETALLDAHSFTWMIATKLPKSPMPFDRKKYADLTSKEKEIIVKARIGQGRFRNAVINYWSNCAITGCGQLDLLIASHIKPWIACDLTEAIDPYNGILLSPSLDMAFDSGYITFSDDGKIVISKWLRDSDREALGINTFLKLQRLDPKHLPYLEYHRENVFEKFRKQI